MKLPRVMFNLSQIYNTLGSSNDKDTVEISAINLLWPGYVKWSGGLCKH